MIKKFTITGLIFCFAVGVLSYTSAHAESDPGYIGSKACKECHRKTYRSWKETPMANSYDLLKPGSRSDAKKNAGLDPQKDYTKDSSCLACHTTGMGHIGGFVSEAETPMMVGVGCESCHGAGSEYSEIMGRRGRHYELREVVAAGLQLYALQICITCHNSKSPTYDGKLDPEDEKWHSHDPVKLKYHEHDAEERAAVAEELGKGK